MKKHFLIAVMTILHFGLSPAVAGVATIALPIRINTAPFFVASEYALFAKVGVQVTTVPVNLGKDALGALIDGKADLAVMAETPIALALLGGQSLSIISQIYNGRRTVAIVTRNDRGIERLQDLKGKTAGVTAGTNHAFFLSAMLNIHGLAAQSVKTVNLRPEDVISEFRKGQLDAAVVFEPYLTGLMSELGGTVKAHYGEDVYAFRYVLVGNPSYVEAHSREIRSILSALNEANRLIRTDPRAARIVVGKAIKENDATMQKLFNPSEYSLSLDHSLLLTLDDQARWAMSEGVVKTGPMPNFLNFIRHQHLESVLPNVVRLIRQGTR